MFKTMALIIALLISLGIINSPDQATDQLIQQYECDIIILDDRGM
jgi:hypothetical protein